MPEHLNELGQPVGAPMPDWIGCPPPAGEPLEGRYCRLELLDAGRHAEALHEQHIVDAEGRNWTYLPYGPFAAVEEYGAWVESVQHMPDPMFYCIIDKATDGPVGAASYMRVAPLLGVIEVGHVSYSPALQRTVAATEAQFLMMGHVFDDLGYRRYEWKCDSFNAPSRAAAERLGFIHEGTFRQAVVVKGRNRDTAWYSILDNEWPALKAAFEAWLEPANFETDGRHRTPLGAFMAQSRQTRD